MRVEIIDLDAFGSIKPEALLRFLSVNGWVEVRRVEGELIVFGKPDSQSKTQLIWMPTSDQYVDYVPMVSKLVRTVAEVDDKSELQLLDDLETVAVGDVIGVRTYNPLDVHDHTLPLADGVDLLTRSRVMAGAAAASVVNKRPVHPRRLPLQATQFVRDLRLGQTQRGSYTIRLIAPILEQPKRPEGQLEGMPDEQPFTRRAVIELVRGLNALREAAEDNKDRGRFFFNSFLSAVPYGVSANLCEALISPENEDAPLRPLEVNVTWSYAVTRTDNLPSAPIRFDSSIAPFIRQAASEFRARNPEIVTLNGWVNILERDFRSGPGLIRLYARVDGRARAVRMQLEKEQYDLAIDAHKGGSLVSVTGTLIVEHSFIYRLEKPTDFRIVEQEGLFDLDDKTNN